MSPGLMPNNKASTKMIRPAPPPIAILPPFPRPPPIWDGSSWAPSLYFTSLRPRALIRLRASFVRAVPKYWRARVDRQHNRGLLRQARCSPSSRASSRGAPQQFGEHHGRADIDIPAGRNQRQRLALCQLSQMSQCLRLLTGLKLIAVTAAEFGKSPGVVAVPLAQRCRWRHLLAPLVDLGI